MDLKDKKTILRKFPSSLLIVTANYKKEATGAVISFATQISFEPPLIALAVKKDSRFYDAAKFAKYLAVHLPSIDQKQMVSSFFKIKNNSSNTINGYGFEWSELKTPILNEIPMYLEVKINKIVEIGDHPLFICEVVNANLKKDTKVLTMSDTNWNYGG